MTTDEPQKPATKSRRQIIGEALLPRDSEFTIIFAAMAYLLTFIMVIMVMLARTSEGVLGGVVFCGIAWGAAVLSSLLFWDGLASWLLRCAGICIVFTPPILVNSLVALYRFHHR